MRFESFSARHVRRPRGGGFTVVGLGAAAVVLGVLGVALLLPAAAGRGAADAPAQDPAGVVQAVPDQAVPDQPVPDQPVPDQPVPDQPVPDQLVPDQLVPDQLVPDQAVPDQPVDRLAGPVPADEVAAAFAQAMPGVPGLDAASTAALTQPAVAAVEAWHSGAGWVDVEVQATSITELDPANALVNVLWSGTHPVTGPADRKLATVLLTPVPGTADWAVSSIDGGPADG